MSRVSNSKHFKTAYYMLSYGLPPKALAKKHGWRFVKTMIKEYERRYYAGARKFTHGWIDEYSQFTDKQAKDLVVDFTCNPCKTEEVTWH